MNLTIVPVSLEKIWDDFVLQYAPSALFQSWSWCDVQEKLEQCIWRFGLYKDAQLVGVFAILKVPARRGTFLHVRHGPIFVSRQKEFWEKFLDFTKDLAKKEHAWFIRVSPLIDDTEENRRLFKNFGMKPAAIHAMDAELSWVLDIDVPEDKLLSGMRKTTRYEIRQAEKLGVKVNQSTTMHDLTKFFRLYTETSHRQQFVPHQGIAEEFAVFTKKSQAVLLLGEYKGEILAGAIILFWGNQAFYHHGASVTTKVPVSYFVQWKAIAEAKKRGIKVYNFWGIAPEEKLNHPWRGLTLFKKGFGGREVKFIHAHDLPISALYPLSRTIESIRRIRKGY